MVALARSHGVRTAYVDAKNGDESVDTLGLCFHHFVGEDVMHDAVFHRHMSLYLRLLQNRQQISPSPSLCAMAFAGVCSALPVLAILPPMDPKR